MQISRWLRSGFHGDLWLHRGNPFVALFVRLSGFECDFDDASAALLGFVGD